MTQRVFDIENEKDMSDLWDILPIGIIRIRKNETQNTFWSELFFQDIPSGFIQINWHDKTEITRPIQEATEADIGKLCVFWDERNPEKYDKHYGIFTNKVGKFYELERGPKYNHCRRLTKEEVSELC